MEILPYFGDNVLVRPMYVHIALSFTATKVQYWGTAVSRIPDTLTKRPAKSRSAKTDRNRDREILDETYEIGIRH